MPENFWLIFLANLPVVTALFVALQKKWIIMGVTFEREMREKNQEIAFREQLRQEALEDRKALQIQQLENREAMKELTVVVKSSLELTEHLVGRELERGWDGNDRRSFKAPTRAR